MQNRLPDLVANLSVAYAHCLDILLIKHNAAWSMRQVKHAFLSGGHTLKNPQHQAASAFPLRNVFGRPILDQNREIVDSLTEPLG